jgi:hypothetical protein
MEDVIFIVTPGAGLSTQKTCFGPPARIYAAPLGVYACQTQGLKPLTLFRERVLATAHFDTLLHGCYQNSLP